MHDVLPDTARLLRAPGCWPTRDLCCLASTPWHSRAVRLNGPVSVLNVHMPFAMRRPCIVLCPGAVLAGPAVDHTMHGTSKDRTALSSSSSSGDDGSSRSSSRRHGCTIYYGQGRLRGLQRRVRSVRWQATRAWLYVHMRVALCSWLIVLTE